MTNLVEVTEALNKASEFGLDGTDLLILRTIADVSKEKGEATIMSLASAKFASFGTIHARVKRMIKQGFLDKQIKESNQRLKVLNAGPKFDELVQAFNSIK